METAAFGRLRASSHTKEFIQYCDNHLIKLYCILPHTTHFTRPLNVVVFQPYKHFHPEVIGDADWMYKLQHYGVPRYLKGGAAEDLQGDDHFLSFPGDRFDSIRLSTLRRLRRTSGEALHTYQRSD